MKRFLLLCVAVASIAFVGCSDDDKETGSKELVGTKWVYEEGDLLSVFWQEDITFNSVNKFTYHYMELVNFQTTDEGEAVGSYTYNPPTITGKVSMDGVEVALRGEISGDNMTVYVNGEEYGVYKLDK